MRWLRLGSEAGAQQVERVDGVAGIGVRLLLDDMPALADAERRRSHPQPPRQVQAAPDLADGGVDDLEVGGVAEPGAEDAAHRVGSFPIHRTWRQHGPELHGRCQGGCHALVVAVGECFSPDRPAGHRLAVPLSCG
jgi:hypothetical protein